MIESALKFIQDHSPDGGFLQSQYWRKFQESVGRKTFFISEKDEEGKLIASASIIKYTLPIVGDYFYIPRGPVLVNYELGIMNYEEKAKIFIHKIIKLAKQHKIGWIRVEPASNDILEFLRFNLKNQKIKKSSVDIQPREILVMDISKSEEEILAQMKQKTRYNIRLSQKRKVSVKVISNFKFQISKKYFEEFLKLVNITAKRDKIKSHPENYYRQMFEVIPPELLKLYCAEYEGKIIAANLVLFFGKTATYMHGASDNAHRDVMAPYLLQWRAVLDAKKAGCTKYDFGGINTQYSIHNTQYNKWSGITRFKQGFAPETEPVQFPGCYDIILKPGKYSLYRILQKVKKYL